VLIDSEEQSFSPARQQVHVCLGNWHDDGALCSSFVGFAAYVARLDAGYAACLLCSYGHISPVRRQGLIARQTPGYAIGGLAGGEDKETFCRVVSQCTAALPPGKPRYVMGIGCAPVFSHVC